jgi:integrase
MSSRKDPRTGHYFYRKWVVNAAGERERIFSATDEAGQPFKKKSEADAAEQRAIERLRNPERQPIPSFEFWFNGRFWTEWVLGGPRGANSPSERESKRLIFGKWLKPAFGSLPLDRIDAQAINTFRARLRALTKKDGSRQVKEKTLNNILAVLSTPLQYAAKVGILMRAPEVGVAKVERPEIAFIEFEEYAALIKAAREDELSEAELAVLLDYEAGMRVGEIRALEYEEQVDMRARTLTVDRQVRLVRGDDGKYRDVLGPPKGRRRRVVPMSPALYQALRDRVRRGHVVGGEGGRRKTSEEFKALMKRIVRRAGLEEKISGWHIGRHTFGTHAAMLNVNPWVLQLWMGHGRLEETQLYADVARAHGRKIPPSVLAAGADQADLNLRVLAQLSARAELEAAAPMKARKR